ncbi:MAG: hypothetical protein ACTHJW_11000 [Streptosporangiaceae bacterium]
MSRPDDRASKGGQAAVPAGLVTAVVDLVSTGPVLLGAYTIAELTAVDAIVDFLEARPAEEAIAEAVRSLAARQLLVAGTADGQVQVRGDLGIAVALQQRGRVVLDARATGTVPGEPWRILVLPQPEPISLVIRIDALGVHELGLYQTPDALDRLASWLPEGDVAERADENPDDLLAAAERSALVTVTRYSAEGSAEVAGASADLVLARRGGALHAFARSDGIGPGELPSGTPGEERSALVRRRLHNDSVRETLARMLE